MAQVLRWSLKKMVLMILKIVNNKFDCFITIEGKRGLGKSTLAYHLARGVSREAKKQGIENYRFSPKRDLLYERIEVLKFFNKWRVTGIADEMINVSFNRDFYNEDQKDLIKMINMNRDHCNLFIACVPDFKNLDNQIKNLCKIRITVIRRGIAIIQTPNRTIYSRDQWDQSVNEKIERQWLEGNTKKPKYTKLTTFRGLLTFPPLKEASENLYQKIKNEKRHLIAKEAGLEDVEKEIDPFTKVYNDLIDGKIRGTQILDGMAQFLGMTPNSLKSKLRTRLVKEHKISSLTHYYFDTKEKKEEQKKQGRNKIRNLIESVKARSST